MATTAADAAYDLLDGFTEAELYHQNPIGFFSILKETGELNKDGYPVRQQRSFRVSQMSDVIRAIDKDRNTWISQSDFFMPTRRIIHLKSLNLCFVDLDYYYTDTYEFWEPERVSAALLYAIEDADVQVPPPSLIISSGQGLQIKWILEKSLPRQALPRWNAMQRVFVERLSSFGADPKAKDASRVLRLVGTVNGKSGERVRVIHDSGLRYDFEYLATEYLPLGRDDSRLRTQSKPNLKTINGGKEGLLKGFSGRSLAWHRLEDLRSLARMRGGVYQGERMTHLFWQMNFLLLSGATNTAQMGYEARALAREIAPDWQWNESELGSLYKKAKDASAGKTIEFNGKSWTPLYTPKNQTLIDLFEITDDEQKQLRTIITKDLARKRDAERKREIRRGTGMMDRETYLTQNNKNRAEAIKMRNSGMSQRAIADALGVSAGSVNSWLR